MTINESNLKEKGKLMINEELLDEIHFFRKMK